MTMRPPPVELARGDRVGGHRITSILGWGREGVAAEATDEFLQLPRVLKAYPAEAVYVDRVRHVADAFGKLSELDLSPRPLSGGVASTNRGVPVVYLVVERRVGRPLDQLLMKPWSKARAGKAFAQIAHSVARVHRTGWAIGDFQAGNNIVLHEDRYLFIDIGMSDEEEQPSYFDDFVCLCDLAERLARLSTCDRLQELSEALTERAESRLDRRSLTVLLRRLEVTA